MKWFERFVAGKSVVLEDARDAGMHGLVVTNSIQIYVKGFRSFAERIRGTT
jgi:hypothetical protein